MYDELVKMLRVCGDSNNSCGNCPVRENDGSCPHGEWEFAAEKYMLQAADAIEELSKRVPVPPHGRLIDADALEKHIKDDWEEYDHWIAVEVENRPTIIPAEEGET